MKTFIKKRSQKKKSNSKPFLTVEDHLIFKEKLADILNDFSSLSDVQEETNRLLFGQLKELTSLNTVTEEQIKSFK